jgi:hypothetical protein
MSSVFTDYVRSLEPGGGPPSEEDFERVWAELFRVLAWQLKRRHLWTSPPSYLGIYGWQSWTEKAALEDLAADCYVFVFLDRLRSLKAHAATKPDVEGLVSLYVRQFLHVAQKKQDPLGFKVFDLLRSALRRLLDNGAIHVLKGPENVRNDTVFGFSRGEDPGGAPPSFDGAAVAAMSDAILPAVVTSRQTTPEAVERLAAVLSGLPERGVRVFRFRDLVDPVKADVRTRWAKVLEELRGETAAEFDDENGRTVARFVALTRPETDFEERDWIDKLADCVDRGLKRLNVRARTREYLDKLWAFLHGYARDVASAELPSHRKLSELLDIPRERLPELYGTLGTLLEQCRVEGSAMLDTSLHGALTGAMAGALPRETAAAAEIRSMDGGRSRREALRSRTGEALARLAEPAAPPAGPPRPGDLYVLDKSEHVSELEWAVLLRAAGGCLLVPADAHPLTGSDDVAVGRESRSGPLNLRCGFAVWVAERRLAGATRSGAVGADVVARAQVKLAEAEDAEEWRGLPAELEADRDPEYEDWRRDVLEPARAALADVRPRVRERRRSGVVVPLALAAALAAAVVGMAVLWRQVGVLSQPSLDVARHDVVFKEVPREGTRVELDSGAKHVLLPLILRNVPRHEGYVVEIAGEDGDVVFRRGVLAWQPQYRLLLPRSRLPAGVYYLRLYGVDDETEVLVDEQEREIRYRAPP